MRYTVTGKVIVICTLKLTYVVSCVLARIIYRHSTFDYFGTLMRPPHAGRGRSQVRFLRRVAGFRPVGQCASA